MPAVQECFRTAKAVNRQGTIQRGTRGDQGDDTEL